MKNILKNFFVLVITLFGVTNVFAVPTPPSPGAKKPPPPPGLPIDTNVSILIIMGIFLGIYIIYKYQSNKKASII